ncbi:hypothetical protein B0T44_15860 [Nocardia donostiensis]|uniref:Uncharacterized protein n=1 Tax=Nocardia donostiensis TaxID=1538463 RepID=A0A1W0B9F7_9NOCA|nr:hypothetical protein B0T46_20560 [Nocardia donostiensis]OQS19134.1 hypothetical protein B0T44_15860 [Nocardia donostiensis]
MPSRAVETESSLQLLVVQTVSKWCSSPSMYCGPGCLPLLAPLAVGLNAAREPGANSELLGCTE